MRVWLALLIALWTSAASGSGVERQELQRAGGRISFGIDLPDHAGPVPLLVLAQGSGCLPSGRSDSLAAVRAAFADYAALTVEKRGVDPLDQPADAFLACGDDFAARHSVGDWVDDFAAVVAHVRGAPWWNGQLVLFGGSEGGLAMARLAPIVAADAAILLSTGGGLSFGDAILMGLPPEGQASVGAQFDAIRAAPESSQLFAGSSFRFWADSMDRRVVDDMVAGATRFLLLQGDRDQAGTVAAARAAAEVFRQVGNCRLSYRELADLDHGLARSDGQSELLPTLAMAAAWTQRQLSATGDCASP